VKGAVKEKVGKLTRSSDVEAKGKGGKVAGKVQKKIGQVKQVLGQGGRLVPSLVISMHILNAN
jgi:uncharacterized protein YjbJ (UPF0337 family)